MRRPLVLFFSCLFIRNALILGLRDSDDANSALVFSLAEEEDASGRTASASYDKNVTLGKTVRLTLTGWDSTGDTSINFFAGEDVSLEFRLRTADGAYFVERTSKIPGVDIGVEPEMWGGWPFAAFAAGKPVVVEFTLRNASWEVSIGEPDPVASMLEESLHVSVAAGGALIAKSQPARAQVTEVSTLRTPWFDYRHKWSHKSTTVNKIQVGGGLHLDGEPEVVVLKCNTKCADSECRATSGVSSSSTCDGTTCYSRSDRGCNEAQEPIGEETSTCCTGLAPPLSSSDVQVGDVVTLIKNMDYLERTCGAALQLTDACKAIELFESFPEAKFEIKEVQKIPALVKVTHRGDSYTLSIWAVAKSKIVWSTFDFNAGTPGIVYNVTTGEVLSNVAGGQAAAHGVQPGLFMKELDGFKWTAVGFAKATTSGHRYSITFADVDTDTSPPAQTASASDVVAPLEPEEEVDEVEEIEGDEEDEDDEEEEELREVRCSSCFADTRKRKMTGAMVQFLLLNTDYQQTTFAIHEDIQEVTKGAVVKLYEDEFVHDLTGSMQITTKRGQDGQILLQVLLWPPKKDVSIASMVVILKDELTKVKGSLKASLAEIPSFSMVLLPRESLGMKVAYNPQEVEIVNDRVTRNIASMDLESFSEYEFYYVIGAAVTFIFLTACCLTRYEEKDVIVGMPPPPMAAAKATAKAKAKAKVKAKAKRKDRRPPSSSSSSSGTASSSEDSSDEPPQKKPQGKKPVTGYVKEKSPGAGAKKKG